jgi:hypothetical protein
MRTVLDLRPGRSRTRRIKPDKEVIAAVGSAVLPQDAAQCTRVPHGSGPDRCLYRRHRGDGLCRRPKLTFSGRVEPKRAQTTCSCLVWPGCCGVCEPFGASLPGHREVLLALAVVGNCQVLGACWHAQHHPRHSRVPAEDGRRAGLDQQRSPGLHDRGVHHRHVGQLYRCGADVPVRGSASGRHQV